MSLVLADRVKETTTSTGTGTITLGGAVAGFQSFSVIGNGNTTYYTISGGTQWEVGTGTYNANTLTRDTVLDSSSGGALVIFASGSKDVFVTLPAEKAITSIASADSSVTVTQVGTEVNLAVSGGSGTVTSVAATAGTGISITGSPITTSGTLNITNTAPDQTVALTQGGTTTITGTYPNFTISSADQFQGTVISVTGTAPVVSSGGATPAISMAAATTSVNGYLTSTDWTTFNNKGSGTVTSVAALTLGTTGTDLSSTVATGTSTPVITLQVPTASASNRGALSAADWSTFNGKGVLAKSTSAFTTGTAQTYTAPANTQWVKVTVVGPGGNGGSAANQRATGGGGGGVAIKWLSMTAGQTLVYTVGTASGTASTVASGTLTITTTTANSGTNGTTTIYALSQTAGGAGGTATNGNVNITGGQGGYSYGSSTTVTTNFSGKGGDCPGFGSGGPSLAMVATAGVQGQGFGAGGGGAHGNATTAAGRGGIIIFEAY